MNYVIREANKIDICDLTELTNQLGYSSSSNEIDERFINITNSSNDIIFVAEHEKKVIGWVHAFVAYRLESNTFAELGGLVVHENYRSKGIGKSLINKCIEWSKEKDITKLRVRCNRIRKETHVFYNKIGFDEIKEQKIFQIDLKS